QLAECYRKTQQWPELVQVLEHHSNVEEDPQKKVDLLIDLAERYEVQLGNAGMSIASYRRAINADSTSMTALNSLERLYIAAQSWSDLIEILGRKAAIIDDTDKVIILKRRIGELYDQRLNDPNKAIVSHKEILEIDGSNLPAMK